MNRELSRLVFMGTADLAATVLRKLHARWPKAIQAVVSQPDRPKGRDPKLQATPVRLVADELGLPLYQPARARDPDFVETLRKLSPELIVVAAYGQLLPASILEIPPLGCLNVHTSLLPRHRGAAPIVWAIADGDSETGVTIMKMDVGLDTGPILSQAKTPIGPEETGQSLHDRLADFGSELLVATIPDVIAGRCVPQPQRNEGTTYARKITREDGRLDWTQEAETLERRLRAFTPWPGGFCFERVNQQDRLIKVHRATAESLDESAPPGTVIEASKSGILVACGKGGLRLLELQREGGRRLSAEAFLAGNRVDRFY